MEMKIHSVDISIGDKLDITIKKETIEDYYNCLKDYVKDLLSRVLKNNTKVFIVFNFENSRKVEFDYDFETIRDFEKSTLLCIIDVTLSRLNEVHLENTKQQY